MKPLPACQAKPILRAYESLTRESWFNRNAVTERELLKLLFALRGDGSGRKTRSIRRPKTRRSGDFPRCDKVAPPDPASWKTGANRLLFRERHVPHIQRQPLYVATEKGRYGSDNAHRFKASPTI